MTDRRPTVPTPDMSGYHMPAQPAAGGQGQLRADSRVPRTGGKGAGTRRPPPRRRSFVATALMAIGFLLLTFAVFVTAFILGSDPGEIARVRLIETVKAKTGRDLAIRGGTSLKFYPSLGIVLKDVTLSGPPGMAGGPTVKASALDVSIRLAALLSRQVEVERLLVRDADIDLRIDKAGRRSWETALTEPETRPIRYAAAGGAASDAKSLPPEARDFLKNANDETARQAGIAKPTLGGVQGVALEDVRLENGRIRYTDERTGAPPRDVSGINATLNLKQLDSPLAAAGNLTLDGEKIEFDGRVTTPADVIAKRPAKVTLNVGAQPVKAAFEGAVTLVDAVEINGQIDASSPSLRALARWLGTELPPANGFGPLAVKATVKASGAFLTLSDAALGLDGATATGTLTLDARGAKPAVTGSLKISELDLNKYASNGESAPVPAKAPKQKGTQAVVPAAGAPQAGAAPKSIDDLLNEPGPKVKGYSKRAGWSEEPINVAGLSLLDVDLTLTVGKILVRDVKVGQSKLKIALKDSHLKVPIEDVALYDGRAHGLITVEGATGQPVVGVSLVADGIAARPFLTDVAQFDSLSGTAKLTVAVAGSGASERAIIDATNGTASFTFANGAVAGYNVAGILRGLSQGKLNGLQSSPAEKTDFSELAATFNIQNGVADNQDLRLVSPLLRVTGAGRIMLGDRQIDYTVKPKLVSSLSGQGGPADAAGIEVPLKITGSWDAPRVAPDVTSAIGNVQNIVKDPSKAAGAVKEIGKQLGGKKPAELLKGLLGGN